MSYKQLKKLFFTMICFALSFFAKAQLLDFSPNFPTETDNIMIIHDVSKGTAGLKYCARDVYIHTGVITN